MIILDTSVASELMKQSPSSTVDSWLEARSATELFTTSITLAEVRYGIERLHDGCRKNLLRSSAEAMFDRFQDQILPFDTAAAVEYAELVSERERVGKPIVGFDAQIASICRARDATLATRNVKDFEDTGVDLISPWQPRR